MRQIKFSHEYPKLWEQKAAVLIYVRVLDAEKVQENKNLLEYDTRYYTAKMLTTNEECTWDYTSECDYYTLPKTGKLIQLVFIGNDDIPFCTLRRYTPQKLQYYKELLLELFEIMITTH